MYHVPKYAHLYSLDQWRVISGCNSKRRRTIDRREQQQQESPPCSPTTRTTQNDGSNNTISTTTTVTTTTTSAAKRGFFNKQPRDLIYSIFTFLTTTEILCVIPLVCKVWKLSADGYFVRTCTALHFDNSTNSTTDAMISAVLKKCMARSNNGNNNNNKNDANFLHTIDLTDCESITDETLRAIALHCPNLRDLTLEACTGVTLSGIECVVKASRHLEKLNLSGCAKLQHSILPTLCEYCPKLRFLAVDFASNSFYSPSKPLQLPQLDTFYGEGIHDQFIIGVLANCKNLRQVRLLDNEGITEEGIRALAEGCPLLESVDLTGCALITDACIEVLAERCSNLKELILLKCPGISTVALQSLAAHTPRLTSFYISDAGFITDAGMQALLVGCTELEQISFDACPQLTVKTIDAIISSPSIAPRLTLLEACSVTGAISDAHLAGLAANCPNLQVLQLSNNLMDITDRGVSALAVAPCNKSLRTLDLSGASRITDASLKLLARHCTNLETISFDECTSLTDDSVIAFVRYCPRLRNINFLNGFLSDKSLCFIAENSNELETLEFGSNRITDRSLLALAKANQRRPALLRNLREFCCTSYRITDVGAIALFDTSSKNTGGGAPGAGLPNLEVLNLAVSDITHKTIETIADAARRGPHYRKLRSLCLDGCRRLFARTSTVAYYHSRFNLDGNSNSSSSNNNNNRNIHPGYSLLALRQYCKGLQSISVFGTDYFCNDMPQELDDIIMF